METPNAAPPAAPVAPAPTISAERDAANRGDFAAFDEASNASQRGTPFARVEAPVEKPAAAPGAPETPPAPRELSRKQQEINERAQRAVETATADIRAENARLKAQLAAHQPVPQPTPPSAPAAPAVPAEPAWRRYAAMPDAPKLSDVDAQGNALFSTVEEHAAAMTLFVNQQERAAEQSRTEGERLATHEHQRISAFDARVTEIAKADPEIVAKIAPLAQALGTAGGPYRIIGQLALDSERGPELLRHFADHQDDLQRLATIPAHLQGLSGQIQVKAHVQWMVKELGKIEGRLDGASPPAPVVAPATSTISAAPPPAPSLSRTGASADPQAAAFARGDFPAWEKHETAKDLAKRGAA